MSIPYKAAPGTNSIQSWFLLGLIALGALAFAVIVPPFQVCDEHAHFVRAYDISLGHMVSEPVPDLPPAVVSAILRYPELLEIRYKIPASDVVSDAFGRVAVHPGTTPALADDAGHAWLTHGILATNVYCPIAYLPASAGIWIGRLLGLPPLALLYAGRLGDVLFFVAACALAFRLAPEYTRLIAMVALLPMTLHQAGGVTADVMTIAVSFVAVACLLWLRQNVAKPRSLVWVGLVFAVWAVCKISPWTFAALLLIPGYRFASRRTWLGYIGAVALGMAAAILVWHAISSGNLEALRARRYADGFDMSANSRDLLTHPLGFAGAALTHEVTHYKRYIQQFVGGFGWTTDWMAPVWPERFCFLLLLIVAATERASKPFSKRERYVLCAVFVIGVVFLHVALFVSDSFDGIQGRYFIPFSLFGLLAIRQNKFTLPNGVLTAVVALTGSVLGILVLSWISVRYYF